MKSNKICLISAVIKAKPGKKTYLIFLERFVLGYIVLEFTEKTFLYIFIISFSIYYPNIQQGILVFVYTSK